MATLSKNQLAALQALYQKEQEAPTCKLPTHIEWQRGNVHYFDVFGYGKFTRATNNALIQKGMIEEYAFGKDDVIQFIRLTPAGKAALGISDEPQPAVAVETPAASDSGVGGFEVGDMVAYQDVSIHTGKASTKKTTIKRFSGKLAVLKTGKIIRTKDLTFVERPTIAAVAINDDSAVDNTPSEVEREIEQPSDSPITFDGIAVNELSNSRLATLYYVMAETSNDNEEIMVLQSEMERRNLGGWVADALATVNVTSEAAANDDYLPPTVEDNDDLPFSDLGEDDTPNWTSIDGDIIDSQRERIYELEAQNWQRNETIASLEARVLSLEYALARIAEYGWTEHLMDDILKMQQIAVKAITKKAVQ